MAKIHMTWPPRSYRHVIERVEAVAYATQQVNGFEAANVTADIQKWLAKDGYDVEQSAIAATLDTMHDKGWAIRVVKGRRTTGFVLHPDLVVPIPAYVQAKQARGETARRSATPTPPATRTPPVPRRAPAVPAVFAELGQLAADWWRDDPDAALAWAAAAVEGLRR